MQIAGQWPIFLAGSTTPARLALPCLRNLRIPNGRRGAFMYCSKCGNLLAAGNAFCQVCGTPVSTVAPAAAMPAPSQPPTPGVPASPAFGATTPALPGQAAVSPHWLPTPARTYAGFWLRLVAHLIDDMIIGVVL